MDNLHPNSFNSKSMILLKSIENYENKINYKSLSYKIFFTEEDIITSHEINLLKKYDMLYDLLNDLVTNKISINNENIDQIHLVSNLMQGYDKNDLFAERTKISAIKSKSCKNKFLKKAQTIFYNRKKI